MYKILTYILNLPLQPLAENGIGEYQSGFRRGRLTVDQIFTVKQIQNKAWEYAQDSIKRERLDVIFLELGITSKLVTLIRVAMKNTEVHARLRTRGGRWAGSGKIKPAYE